MRRVRRTRALIVAGLVLAPLPLLVQLGALAHFAFHGAALSRCLDSAGTCSAASAGSVPSATPRSSAPAPMRRRCCRRDAASTLGSAPRSASSWARWSAPASARSASAMACAAPISRWSRWPLPRSSASSPTRAFTGAGVGIQIPLSRPPRQFPIRRPARLLLCHAGVLGHRGCRRREWLTRSRFGAQLVAVRENEDAAQALGIDVVPRQARRHRAFGRAGGARRRASMRSISSTSTPPSPMDRRCRSTALLVPMIGGVGTVLGPLGRRSGAARAQRGQQASSPATRRASIWCSMACC